MARGDPARRGAGRCVRHNDSGPSHILNLIHNATDAATRRTSRIEHGTEHGTETNLSHDGMRRVAPPHDHASVISALLGRHPAAGCVSLAQMQDGTFPARIRVWLAQVLAAYVLVARQVLLVGLGHVVPRGHEGIDGADVAQRVGQVVLASHCD